MEISLEGSTPSHEITFEVCSDLEVTFNAAGTSIGRTEMNPDSAVTGTSIGRTEMNPDSAVTVTFDLGKANRILAAISVLNSSGGLLMSMGFISGSSGAAIVLVCLRGVGATSIMT